MKGLELQPGEQIELGAGSWEVLRPLFPDSRSHAWLARDGDHLRWLWTGPAGGAWADILERTLDRPRYGLPRLLAVTEEEGRAIALLDHHRPEAPILYDEDWLELSNVEVIDALQRLVLSLGILHESDVCLGGLSRSHLLWDAASGSFYIAAMPKPRERSDSSEDVWRDIKLIGELLYENFKQRKYPGGHEMAAMLQEGKLDHGEPWQPGLPQLLAGCVTPYGELALRTTHELWVALEHLRIEIEQPLSFRVGSRSTVGSYIFRKNNQDSCGHVQMQTISGSRKVTLGFYCVADGIGGIKDGERASALAVSAGCAAFSRASHHRNGEVLLDSPTASARAIARVVSQQLALEGEFDPRGNRGGTTFSGLVVAGARVGIGHVGDSRIYLFRDDTMILLTRDHTLSTILNELGELDPDDEVKRKASERTISRFMTSSGELDDGRVDSFTLEAADALGVDIETLFSEGLVVRPGDLFLLTSDGVHGELDPEELVKHVRTHQEHPDRLCETLVNKVVVQMGHDNVTALAVRVD